MIQFVSKLRGLVRKAILGGVEDADLQSQVRRAVVGGVHDALDELHTLLDDGQAIESVAPAIALPAATPSMSNGSPPQPAKRGRTKGSASAASNGHVAANRVV